jgi:hypothetical protein
MFHFGQQTGSKIGRVLDERGRSPKKTLGTIKHAQAAPTIRNAAISGQPVRKADSELDGFDASAELVAGSL